MTMQVLQSKAQISDARRELDRRGLSALSSPVSRTLSKLGLRSGPVIGDRLKSWDVLASLDFIERNVSRDSAVLDIGAYGSEILSVLRRLGYGRLYGVDLNPLVTKLPHNSEIHYKVGNFLQAPFEDGTFGAITAISVIEHGFQPDKLLSEMSRLLRPGGFFIASFDYWPDKIETNGQQFFGLDWLIFSAADVERFVAKAREYSLKPAGPVSFDAAERPIECASQRYTFGWLVLEKV